jgi:hypothetical protein
MPAGSSASDDGADEHQRQRDKEAGQEQQTTHELNPEDDREQMCRGEAGHVLRRAAGGRRHVQEVEKAVSSEERKQESEQDSSDKTGNLHSFSRRAE